ncbi:hypothetical protein [Burkholderia gladioli]|uniref:hypothetical protein n=1 Tax=Burkholderia gladioli TaxID=28095 RepID=UPI0011D1FB69|nr:hypothetical protein [Burkholderia gladioli]
MDLQKFSLSTCEAVALSLTSSRITRATTGQKFAACSEADSKERSALPLAMAAGDLLPTGAEASLWWGKWSIVGDGRGHGGEVFIREVGPSGFLFDIAVFNGAHIGNLTCYARIVSSDLAYARVKNIGGLPDGELVFRRKLRDGRRWLSVEESASCLSWHGMGASFNGDFPYRFNALFELGLVHELDLMRLYDIVGDFYDAFMERMQQIEEHEDLDDEDARVLIGGVRGMFTAMESILMLASDGSMWAAFIDGDVVRYMTNRPDWKEKLPQTIEHWRSRFAQIPISYHPVVKTVPRRFD